MKEYIILDGDPKSLSHQVSQYLNNGYKLHGDPYTKNNQHFQAVIKLPEQTNNSKTNTKSKE